MHIVSTVTYKLIGYKVYISEIKIMSSTNVPDVPNEQTLQEPSFNVTNPNQPLHDSVRQAIESYLSQLKGKLPENLYELVLAEVEIPLLEAVMDYTRNNQSRAAILLGLSRGTLRKKLKLYGMLS